MRSLGGRCDFAKDIAQPYTLRVIMDIYGVPEEDEALMLELTQGVFGAADPEFLGDMADPRSEEHTSELQSLMRISYAVFCLKKKKTLPLHQIIQFRHTSYKY